MVKWILDRLTWDIDVKKKLSYIVYLTFQYALSQASHSTSEIQCSRPPNDTTYDVCYKNEIRPSIENPLVIAEVS